MEVYIDILLLENFAVNFFLLLLTAKFIRGVMDWKRICISSAMGTVSVFIMFLEVNPYGLLLFKLIVPVLMIYILFGNVSINMLVKGTVTFLGISFILSGLALAIAILFNSRGSLINVDIGKFSVKWLIVATVIIYFMANRFYQFLKERSVINNFIYDIYISIGEKSLLVRGFLDTGNELREPITNLPCILIEEDYLCNFKVDEKEKFNIGYKTIDGKGNLSGFKTTEVKIKNGVKSEWTNIEAIICSCSQKLSKENDYQALLSRGIV